MMENNGNSMMDEVKEMKGIINELPINVKNESELEIISKNDENISSNNDADNYNDFKISKYSKSKRSKKIACTECRQQKAKCDAFEKSPNSCSRCVKRNIPCRLDSDFKRTFKRAKIYELVKEYEIIKSKLKTGLDISNIKSMRSQSPSPNIASNSDSNIIVNNNTNNENLKSNQTHFLPPIQNFQQNPNFLQNTTRNVINNQTQLPNPNIFLNGSANQLNNNNHSPITPSVVQRSSLTNDSNYGVLNPLNRPNSPLTTINRNQYSPLSVLNRPNSPLNHEINNNNYNQQIPTTNSYSQPALLVNTPKFDFNHSNSTSRINSSYNLTTLISAANASTKNDNDKSSNIGPSVYPSNNTNYNHSSWKIQSHPVEKPRIDSSILECTPKSLGEITLTEDQIVILYTNFVTYYHPLLPIVDINKGIERIYRLCPVLFWTIMLTSLRGHHNLLPTITQSDCQSLYFTLSPILKSVLAEITISPITRYAPTEVEEPILNASSVYSVQAFLLYTFWPPLTSSLSADSSWNTIGIAIYQAIRIGLHSPGHTSDGLNSTNKDLLNEQIKTWIACNIVSQTIGTVFGFPGFVQSCASLLVTWKDSKGIYIPKTLVQMLEIQIFEEQVAKTLNSNTFDPLRLSKASEKLPMIALLDNELDLLELRLCSDPENSMDDFRKLSLYASRLHLLTYNFLDTEQVSNFELKKCYIKTYNAALKFLQHIKDSRERDSHFVNNLPTAYILMIWQASVIIARLVNSSYKNILDIGAGKQLYQTAIGLAMNASVIKHDLAYRSCGIMKSTWNLFRTLDEEKSGLLKVNVRSRMSASVFFDSLWILREKCGMIKLRPIKEKASVSESVESDSDVEVIDDEPNNKVKVEDKSGKRLINGHIEARSHSKESSTSSSKKKSNYHPESAARRIISTIPLDPQPIALAETPQESGSSKQSSPYLSNYKSPTNVDVSAKKIITPQSLANASSSQYQSNSPGKSNKNNSNNGIMVNNNNMIENEKIKNNNNNNNNFNSDDNENNRRQILSNNITQISTSEGVTSEVTNVNNGIGNRVEDNNATTNNRSTFLIDDWDVGTDFDSEMLFKDIESVMDEFGFHTNY